MGRKYGLGKYGAKSYDLGPGREIWIPITEPTEDWIPVEIPPDIWADVDTGPRPWSHLIKAS
jgi:hypothetical protein